MTGITRSVLTLLTAAALTAPAGAQFGRPAPTPAPRPAPPPVMRPPTPPPSYRPPTPAPTARPPMQTPTAKPPAAPHRPSPTASTPAGTQPAAPEPDQGDERAAAEAPARQEGDTFRAAAVRAAPEEPARSNDLDWMPLAFVGGGIGVVGVGLVALLRGQRTPHRTPAEVNPFPVHVRITATPPGEAPEEVRRAWVGLELPLAPGSTEPQPMAVEGVVSGAAAGTPLGYAVEGWTAISRLDAHASEAAAWWRAHAPHVMEGGYELIFPAEVCERVG